jgi:cobalt ECF transporter T component CbiQ/cobalamin biosynthesis protein CbiM
MVPMWVTAGRRVRKIVKSRYVPLVAVGAAFSFLVMMFNVPIPDGTTAHAIGATLAAVVLGPWAAVIAVSIALLIQALFFGDGGVLAFAANAFNMALVAPFLGYGLYRLLARRSSLTAPWRAIAAGVGGYAGINAAALCAAIEFGIQPDLFHRADGTPLYAPFHLSQSIPAMMFAHLTIAGLVEGVITAGVVAYLARANLPLLTINHRAVPETDADKAPPRRLGWRWALTGLGAMMMLTPLGLLAPGGAFGEDAPGDLNLGRYGLRAVPAGLDRYSSFWSHTLLGGYGFNSGDHTVIGYLVSAVVGIAVIGLVILVAFGVVRLPRLLRWRRRRVVARAHASAPVQRPPSRRTPSATPQWLLQGEVAMCPCGCVGRRRKGSFVEKTINGGAGVLRQAMFGDEVARRRGLLQRVDARVKVVSLIALLVVAALARQIPVLAGMYAVTLVLAVASGLELGFFIKRVWLFIPIFTGIVVLPATFSFITHGHVVLTLWHWHGQPVGITAQGLTSAGLIISRVATSISLVVLLTLTTPWVKLLAALRALLVPRMFILVIGMAYRYIFLLLSSVTEMFEARKSRAVGGDQDTRGGQRFVAATAGALFGRSHALSEEVHQAMVARGYRGDATTLDGWRPGAIDGVWAVACVALAVVALGGDRLLGG